MKYKVGDEVYSIVDQEIGVVVERDKDWDRQYEIPDSNVAIHFLNRDYQKYDESFLYNWRTAKEIRKLTKLERALK